MQLASSEAKGSRIVHVDAARIDAPVAIQFKDAMRDVTRDSPPRVILDLSLVEFIDSSGLGAVVAAMKQLESESRLDLAGLNPAVDKVFRLTRMDTVFDLYATLDDALARSEE